MSHYHVIAFPPCPLRFVSLVFTRHALVR
jgi:hypothetical protein